MTSQVIFFIFLWQNFKCKVIFGSVVSIKLYIIGDFWEMYVLF